MESIKPQEKSGHPSLSRNEAPKHTAPEHRQCAYYPVISGNIHVGMSCPHDNNATGAFYSEDYIRELKETAHDLIHQLDEFQTKAHATGPMTIVMFDAIFPSEMRQLRNATDHLRLLTK